MGVERKGEKGGSREVELLEDVGVEEWELGEMRG